MDQERARLTVLVPTRDRAQRLDRCLHLLTGQLRPGDELLVVDSCSTTDATRRVAERHGAGVVRADRPGLSRARNLGVRCARHALVAFVDDDVWVCDGWADAMSAAFTDPEAAFVTGWVGVPPDQRDVAEPLPSVVREEPARIDREIRGVFGTGGNFGVRADAYRVVGGCDERLGPPSWFASGDDFDLFDRLVGAGFVGRYDPQVRAYHDQWRSRLGRLRLYWGYGKGRGACLAKVAMRDPAYAGRLAREALWEHGLRVIGHDLRHHYEYGVACGLVRVVGTVCGAVVGNARLREPWELVAARAVPAADAVGR